MLIALGAFDIFSGALIFFHQLLPLNLVFYIAIILLAKGAWSFITCAAGGSYFALVGLIDIAAGIVFGLIYLGITFGFYWIVAAVVIIKGLYSIVVSFG